MIDSRVVAGPNAGPRPNPTSAQPRRSRSVWLAYAALAGAVVAIAWSAIFVRWADIPGSASAFYRVLIASAILLPWRVGAQGLKFEPRIGPHRQTHAPAQPPSSRALWLAVAAGAFFALDLAFFNTAVMRSSAATTSLLGSNAPVFVGLGSWLLLRKKPHGLFWAGLAASMAGIALMLWASAAGAPGAITGSAGAAAAEATGGASGATGRVLDAASLGAPRQSISGDLMAIAAAFCFAGYLLAVSKARETMDTLTLNTIAIAVCTIVLLPICLAIGAPLWGYSRDTWLALIWLGLITQVGAYLCLAYALGHLPATVVSVGLLAQVPLTAMLAAALLHERLTPLQLAGGVLVLAGIYIVTRAEQPPP